jgi:hypothetical protein
MHDFLCSFSFFHRILLVFSAPDFSPLPLPLPRFTSGSAFSITVRPTTAEQEQGRGEIGSWTRAPCTDPRVGFYSDILSDLALVTRVGSDCDWD